MDLNRRSFVATAASLAASAAVQPSSAIAALPQRHDVGANDPLGVRADFPIVANRTYLNSAYIAPIPRQVLAAGQAFMESKATQSMKLADMLGKVEEVRKQFAQLINASPDECTFLYTTSEGENILANALDWSRGDNVVIDELHYEAEFVIYRELESRRGVELRIAKHRDGKVTASDIEPLVDRRTKLVSVAWVSNQNGYRHEMRPIADVAHAHGALFYTDAIQAAGMFPIDVRAAGVDALCSGTYKWLLGGFGVAPFFIKREALDRIRPDRYGAFAVAKELPDYRFELHATAKRFEYATLPFAEVYQLGASLAYLQKVGVARIEEHTVALGQRLQRGLLEQGHKLFTPSGTRSSIVTFYFSKAPNDVRAAFASANVDVTVRDNGQVRVSPALFNTADEVDRFLAVSRRV
jgi:selenocysteine lyase/cysteine desulfurase